MVSYKAIANVIGDNLKSLRKEQGLTMQALANLAEIEKSQIVRIETGKVDAKVSSLLKISKALNIDIRELFKP